MEIYWKSNKIFKKATKLASSDIKAAKKMTNIKAAKDYNDLVFECNGRAHFLKGKDEGCFALDVTDKYNPKRYRCKPFGDCEVDPGGNYKKETITKLIIVDIINDYHKK
ncbi:MAG: hypothetical protein WC788_07360 [Candidatus Paceibacterota bacterium]